MKSYEDILSHFVVEGLQIFFEIFKKLKTVVFTLIIMGVWSRLLNGITLIICQSSYTIIVAWFQSNKRHISHSITM